MKYLALITWAWIIVIGALMITPGGVVCIACGATFSKLIGVLSVALGITAIAVNRQIASR